MASLFIVCLPLDISSKRAERMPDLSWLYPLGPPHPGINEFLYPEDCNTISTSISACRRHPFQYALHAAAGCIEAKLNSERTTTLLVTPGAHRRPGHLASGSRLGPANHFLMFPHTCSMPGPTEHPLPFPVSGHRLGCSLHLEKLSHLWSPMCVLIWAQATSPREASWLPLLVQREEDGIGDQAWIRVPVRPLASL